MAKRRPDPNEVLARITPKPARRIFATGVTGLLGLILIYIAATFPPADLIWLAFLIALGLLCILWAWRLWEASAVVLELTRVEMREEGGRQLFRVEDVDRVDNSAFAFKPAAGFLVHLKTRQPRVYAPGPLVALGRDGSPSAASRAGPRARRWWSFSRAGPRAT
jgi:hypothetical protein